MDLCELLETIMESPGSHADKNIAIFPTEVPLTKNKECFTP